jgi:hypothetical protein
MVRGSTPDGRRDILPPSRPDLGPSNLQYGGYWVSFLGVKQLGHGVNHPPSSGAEVKEGVEIYLYSPSGSSWAVLGWTLHLNVILGTGVKCILILQAGSPCVHSLLDYPTDCSMYILCFPSQKDRFNFKCCWVKTEHHLHNSLEGEQIYCMKGRFILYVCSLLKPVALKLHYVY